MVILVQVCVDDGKQLLQNLLTFFLADIPGHDIKCLLTFINLEVAGLLVVAVCTALCKDSYKRKILKIIHIVLGNLIIF